MQTDYSKHPEDIKELYEITQKAHNITGLTEKEFATVLKETGNPKAVSTDVKNKINTALKAPAGKAYVEKLDNAQATKLESLTIQVVEAAQLNPRYATESVFQDTVHSAAFQALVASNINQYGPPNTLTDLLEGKNVVVHFQNVRIDPDRPFTIESFMRYESHYKMVNDFSIKDGAKIMRNRRINEIENLRKENLLTTKRAQELTQTANVSYHPAGYRVAVEHLKSQGLDPTNVGLTESMAKAYHDQGFSPVEAGKHMADQLGERGAGAASAEDGMTLQEARAFHAISNGATPTALGLSGNLRVSAERLQNNLAMGIAPQKAKQDALDVRAESRKYSGPSTEKSLEDSQTVAQNQAQLARNTQVLNARRAADLLGQDLSLSISPSPTALNSVTIRGIPKGAKISSGTMNAPAPASKRTVNFAAIARTTAGGRRSLLDSKIVESGSYVGPSQEYSPEDFQTAAQNRTQFSTESEIKSAMNTPAYREADHPQFKQTRKGVQEAWDRVTKKAKQEQRAYQKQARTEEKQKVDQAATEEKAHVDRLAKEESETPGAQAPSATTPKQDTLGQEDILGEATQQTKTNLSLLDKDLTQPSNIQAIMNKMARKKKAKTERETRRARNTGAYEDRNFTYEKYGGGKSGGIAGQTNKETGKYTGGRNRNGTPTGGVKTDKHGREIGAHGQFTRDVVGRGDGSAGAGNTRVICTELVRQGRMASRLQRLNIAYTLKKLSPTTVKGYHFWALPYVCLMKKSSLATKIIAPFATWRSLEISYQMDSRKTPHLRGKLVRLIAEPIYWIVGRVIETLPG
ncbi:MAG: hypothetical protein JKY17_09430 [Magnetovibrio sp.]|nr:hypothetical protein [Magnetovibrio sp.]